MKVMGIFKLHKMCCIAGLLALLGFVSAGFAQVPNGNFEAWVTIDSIENPVFWTSNNYYAGFTPVAKTTDTIEGKYSMKISSTAKDHLGTATEDGCAHLKFLPDQEYKALRAKVRIDSVDPEGEVSIRVKQWMVATGLYERIGSWKQSTITNGIISVEIPIQQTGLDTLLIEIWAKNDYDTGLNLGHTEAIVDDLQLSTTLNAPGFDLKNEISWIVFPNPASDQVEIRLNRLLESDGALRLRDVYGHPLQEFSFKNLYRHSMDISSFENGIYFLELSGVDGRILQTNRIIILK